VTGRPKLAISVGMAGAIGASLANLGRLASGSMSPLDGFWHAVAVALITGTLWFFIDMMRNGVHA